MDGRVQQPVLDYLREFFDAEYVDVVSDAGPVRILSSLPHAGAAESIFERVEISLEKHESKGIAVVAHHDCAGNPLSKAKQLEQLRSSRHFLKDRYPEIKIIGLWVDDKWSVKEVK